MIKKWFWNWDLKNPNKKKIYKIMLLWTYQTLVCLWGKWKCQNIWDAKNIATGHEIPADLLNLDQSKNGTYW